jgi:hypothetical protein
MSPRLRTTSTAPPDPSLPNFRRELHLDSQADSNLRSEFVVLDPAPQVQDRPVRAKILIPQTTPEGHRQPDKLAVYHVRRSRRVARGSSARLRIGDVHPEGVVVRADQRFFSVARTNLV